ncbi:MAG TPA: hypothetical protein VMT63_10870 [Bacteroidales bacterium]|nr:hypothetical protein [Bacteroidales bacterium]
MKAKPVIIVVVTLIIGFILGMLVSAHIRYNRLKPVRVFFSEQRFHEGFFNVIQPDEKQKETIEKILAKYGAENSSIQNDFRKKMDSSMKEFWKEIEPVLTKDQLSRLKDMEKRRMEMIHRERRMPGDTMGFGDRRHRMAPPPPDDMHPLFQRDTARSK